MQPKITAIHERNRVLIIKILFWNYQAVFKGRNKPKHIELSRYYIYYKADLGAIKESEINVKNFRYNHRLITTIKRYENFKKSTTRIKREQNRSLDFVSKYMQ